MDLTRVLNELKKDPDAADAAKAMQERVDAGEVDDSDALGSVVEKLLTDKDEDNEQEDDESNESALEGEDVKIATDPVVSEKQRKAMYAALHGKSTLGISPSVAKKFVGPGHDAAPEVISRAAGIILLTPDEHVLLVQRSAKGDHFGEYCFPGGMVEGDETPEEAARRECEEETGYLPEGELHLFNVEVPPEGLEYSTFVHAVPEMFKPEINSESSQAIWRGLDNLPQPLHPGVEEMLAKDAAFDMSYQTAAGVKAKQEGKTEADNPYPKGSEPARLWRDGFKGTYHEPYADKPAKDFSLGQLSSEELAQFRKFPLAKQQKIIYLLEKIKRDPDQSHKFQQELDTLTGDMAPEDWKGLRNGLNKFLDEEEQEEEHAEDGECGPPHSDNPKAKPTGSGGGAIDEQKCSHTEVAYGPGRPESHCGICQFFHNQDCELVVDPIERYGWCKLFTADSQDAVEASDEFKESEHPRKGGKFAPKGSGSEGAAEKPAKENETHEKEATGEGKAEKTEPKGIAQHAAKVKAFLKQPNAHKAVANAAGKFMKDHGLGVISEHLDSGVIIPAVQASVGLALEHLGASVPESLAVSVAGYAVHKLMTKMGYGPENTHKLLLTAGKALLTALSGVNESIQAGVKLRQKYTGDAKDDDTIIKSLERLINILEKTKTKDLMKAAAPPKEDKKAEDAIMTLVLDSATVIYDQA